VEVARALARSGRASAHRAALRSMGTAGNVCNELQQRHEDPRGVADHANSRSASTSFAGAVEKRTLEKAPRSWSLQGIMTPIE
jgi:hypothetical protein